MVVRKAFDLRLQHGEPLFVPKYMSHEIGAGIPDVVRVRIDGCEDIK